MRILLVEDDELIASNVKQLLEQHEYQVKLCSSVTSALETVAENSIDIAIIDWMLADGTGLEVCREIRENGASIPILLLTARSQETDIVEGLNAGADDYVVKPFRIAELLARINALARRTVTVFKPEILTCGELSIDTTLHHVVVSQKETHLSPKEYELLLYLVQHQGQPIERLTLLNKIWGEETDDLSNTVDVHVRFLRKKLGRYASMIVTVKGIGYMICAD